MTVKEQRRAFKSHPGVPTIPIQLAENLQNEDLEHKLNEAEEEFHGWLDDLALYEDANDDSGTTAVSVKRFIR